MLSIKTLDQAARDARNLRPWEKNRVFQPGVETPRAVLEDEQRKLLEWLDSDDFTCWSRDAGLTWDEILYRREELRLIAENGEICKCGLEELPHLPH